MDRIGISHDNCALRYSEIIQYELLSGTVGGGGAPMGAIGCIRVSSCMTASV